jgi:hypothetical protein
VLSKALLLIPRGPGAGRDLEGNMNPLKNYSEKLKDPRWQKRRLEILSRSDFKCDSCESGEKTLHVHHGIYIKGREPWEYEDELLHVLCEECHWIRHSCEDSIKTSLAAMNTSELDDIYCTIFYAFHEFGIEKICKEVGKIHKSLKEREAK